MNNYRPVTLNRATKLFAFSAALNSCNLGFDIGVSTSAGKLLQSENSLHLSDAQISIFMGSLNFFAAIGAIISSVICDRFGRRGGFFAAATGFVIGIIIECLSQSFVILMIGRAIVGIGVGFGLAIDPIYIAEISPPMHRGGLVTWSEIGTNVGILIGFSSSLLFYNVHEDNGWRFMFSFGLVMPLVLVFLLFKIMPESPRWLVSKGRDDEAKLVLKIVYPDDYDIDDVIVEIRDSIERELEVENFVGWEKIFNPTPALRRMVLVGFGAAIGQQIVGIDAIQYFLIYILEEAGIRGKVEQSIILIALGAFKLMIVFVAGSLFDLSGRRPLIFTSLIGMSASLGIISFSFALPDNSASFTIVALALYLAFFSIGMGPGAWLIPAEIFSTSIRAKAMSLSTFLNRITATFATSTFLILADAMSWSGFFAVLSIACIFVSLFFYVYLPETKGTTLEEMSVYFARITGDETILDAEERLIDKRDYRQNTTTKVKDAVFA